MLSQVCKYICYTYVVNKVDNSIFSEILAKLGPDTKTLFADGTFRTAPSLRRGNLYQILKIHVEYKGHVFPGL